MPSVPSSNGATGNDSTGAASSGSSGTGADDAQEAGSNLGENWQWLGPLATWIGVFVIIALLVWGIIYALRANGTSGPTSGYQGRAPAAPVDDLDGDAERQDPFTDQSSDNP